MASQIKTEFRCKNCKKLLAMNTDTFSAVEIKCHRCGAVSSFNNIGERQLVITNRDGVIISINKKTEEITGYELAEVIGKKPSIWGKEMSQAFYEKLWKDLQDKKTIIVKLKNRTKTGKLYNVNLRIQPLLDINNEIAFFLGEELLS